MTLHEELGMAAYNYDWIIGELEGIQSFVILIQDHLQRQCPQGHYLPEIQALKLISHKAIDTDIDLIRQFKDHVDEVLAKEGQGGTNE